MMERNKYSFGICFNQFRAIMISSDLAQYLQIFILVISNELLICNDDDDGENDYYLIDKKFNYRFCAIENKKYIKFFLYISSFRLNSHQPQFISRTLSIFTFYILSARLSNSDK